MVRPAAKERAFVAGTWAVTAALIVVAALRWADVRLGHGPLSLYGFFPLLGLSAFTLMWVHYVIDAIRQYFAVSKAAFKTYFETTSWAVLVLILLHPGLLWYALWADGFGLPPFSYLNAYTGTLTHVALWLGTFSLLIFLAFELRRRYQGARWWRYVDYANVVAMFAIFYHALTLGGEVASGWFRILWFGYGVTLVLAVVYTYYYKRKE
jgi:hypothetical protein